MIAALLTCPALPVSAEAAATGEAIGAPIVVNQRAVRLFRVSFPKIAAAADGRFAVVYRATDNDQARNPRLYARGYGADGAPRGNEVVVDAGVAGDALDYAIDIAANGDFVVAWRVLDGAARGLYIRRHSGIDGQPLAAAERVVDRGVNTPSIAMADDGRFLLAWDNGLFIRSRMFAADGQPSGPVQNLAPVPIARVPYGCPISIVGLGTFGLFTDLTAVSASITPSGDAGLVAWGQSRYTELPAQPCSGSADFRQSRYALRHRWLDGVGRPSGPAGDAFVSADNVERVFTGQPWVSTTLDARGDAAIGFQTLRASPPSQPLARRLRLTSDGAAGTATASDSDILAGDREGRLAVLSGESVELYDRDALLLARTAPQAINSASDVDVSGDGDTVFLTGLVVPPYDSVSNPPLVSVAVQRYRGR